MVVEELETVNAAKNYLEIGTMNQYIHFINSAAADLAGETIKSNPEKIRRTLEELAKIREKRSNIVPLIFRDVESAYKKILQEKS